ncbi:hypothetical protein AgCh_035406 [Apium graveolens]
MILVVGDDKKSRWLDLVGEDSVLITGGRWRWWSPENGGRRWLEVAALICKPVVTAKMLGEPVVVDCLAEAIPRKGKTLVICKPVVTANMLGKPVEVDCPAEAIPTKGKTLASVCKE